MAKTINILLVEDEADYAHAVKELLSPAASFHLTHVPSYAQALAALGTDAFDVVLLDLMLPDNAGLKTFTDIHAAAPELPIVVLTGLADENLALQAVREGAQDYLVKGQLDGKTLERSVRYAIERRRAEHALRSRDEFVRLISENVSDLIAVVDREGRRLYNSPSYKPLLGEPMALVGTDSFQEIHPADRPRIAKLFETTLKTGRGGRAEYRMLLKDGTVRHIESQGNVVRDESNQAAKVVVVSRDITDRKESVEVLRQALSDLKRAHEELKGAQLKLVQAEKVEAVSTFAAGVAHEVKNPLQTLLLGVEYLGRHVAGTDKPAQNVLNDMATAIKRADGIIRALMEFTNYNKREIREEDLSAVLGQAVSAVQSELAQQPIILSQQLALNLPPFAADFRSLKHVFINLLLHVIRSLPPEGGRITVRTFASTLEGPLTLNGKTFKSFKAGEPILWAEIEDFPNRLPEPQSEPKSAGPIHQRNGLGLTVLKKIVELYTGVMEVTQPEDTGGNRYVVVFKAVGPLTQSSS